MVREPSDQSEAALIANLRAQLEALNKVSFSDAQWQRFFSHCIAGAHDGIVEKTARIQQDHVQLLKRDNGSTKGKVDAQWQAFVVARKAEELERIIAEENLNADETRALIDNAFRDGAIPTAGTAITNVLPPVSRFSKDNDHGRRKQTVLDKLAAFFERYFGLA